MSFNVTLCHRHRGYAIVNSLASDDNHLLPRARVCVCAAALATLLQLVIKRIVFHINCDGLRSFRFVIHLNLWPDKYSQRKRTWRGSTVKNGNVYRKSNNNTSSNKKKKKIETDRGNCARIVCVHCKIGKSVVFLFLLNFEVEIDPCKNGQ